MLLVPEETRKRLRGEREVGSAKFESADAILRRAGLRPTRQRLALGRLLFGDGHRHVTVDDLHRDVIESGMRLSLATVYNTLSQFADAGLVRKVAVNGGRSYFDTYAGDHQHFYVEAEDRIFDVPEDSIAFGNLPPPPHGYEIAGVDVVIRLVPTSAEAAASCAGDCSKCGNCGIDFPVPISPADVTV